MSTSAVEFLKQERDKLDQAIRLLEGGTGKKMGRPRKDANLPDGVTGNTSAAPAPKRRRGYRVFTKKQRDEMSRKMKARWRTRREAMMGGKKKTAKAT